VEEFQEFETGVMESVDGAKTIVVGAGARPGGLYGQRGSMLRSERLVKAM